jgi:hypothetical protein
LRGDDRVEKNLKASEKDENDNDDEREAHAP